jgi:HAD superfamily hydrolase (TIGR01509 family)
MADQGANIFPKGVLFDMDGTLTEPMLDFPSIKAEMGIGARSILEALDELSGRQRELDEAVLLRHEEHAAENSKLNPGCREVLDWLHVRGIPTALITRNSRLSVETVLRRHGLCLDALITREDPPFKPDPHPLRLACFRLEVGPEQAWMIGDGQYDVQAGSAAGVRTVWISHGRSRSFEPAPWREVRDLLELRDMFSRFMAMG